MWWSNCQILILSNSWFPGNFSFPDESLISAFPPCPSCPCFHSYHFIKKQINGLPINPVFWLFYLCEFVSVLALAMAELGWQSISEQERRRKEPQSVEHPRGLHFKNSYNQIKGQQLEQNKHSKRGNPNVCNNMKR